MQTAALFTVQMYIFYNRAKYSDNIVDTILVVPSAVTDKWIYLRKKRRKVILPGPLKTHRRFVLVLLMCGAAPLQSVSSLKHPPN